MRPVPQIVSAQWASRDHGTCILTQDWNEPHLPALKLRNTHDGETPVHLRPSGQNAWAQIAAYRISEGIASFRISEKRIEKEGCSGSSIYLAGPFNNWAKAIGQKAWKLGLKRSKEGNYLELCVPLEHILTSGKPVRPFKFVSESGHWISPYASAPNRTIDENGNANWLLEISRQGNCIFDFRLDRPIDELTGYELTWERPEHSSLVPVSYEQLLCSMDTPHPLGVQIKGNKTQFSLFAPRAHAVQVAYSRQLSADNQLKSPKIYDLARKPCGLWSLTLAEKLSGAYYYYYVDGQNADTLCDFAPDTPLTDPYARAMIGRSGPGIILEEKDLKFRFSPFKTPALKDCIICEAHIRDILAKLPDYSPEQSDYQQLAQYLRCEDNYFKRLGINTVELQPVLECESNGPEEYHWGYMPVSCFAPESTYASNPKKASQIRELQELVDAFHKAGIAVILDVVYNHFGSPNVLQHIDKAYYFEMGPNGEFINDSGCGNDFRATTPMGRQLLCDSLCYLVETFNVDGFRFDLGELLGTETLKQMEARVRECKPDVLMIAEPWSFRGHIAYELRSTGYGVWNDGFREFIPKYISGHATQEELEYYMRGSSDFLTKRPCQSIHYTQSHDDFSWIDKITENTEHNGHLPTTLDRRRTHMMLALLFGSLGTPMLAEGQDMLHSKYGVENTYQRGDLNALDYTRELEFSATSQYCKDWITLRNSEPGKLLRLDHKPSKRYMSFDFVPGSSAVAVIFNADHSEHPSTQILLALNPHNEELHLGPSPALKRFEQEGQLLAGPESFFADQEASTAIHDGILKLPAHSCWLFLKR